MLYLFLRLKTKHSNIATISACAQNAKTIIAFVYSFVYNSTIGNEIVVPIAKARFKDVKIFERKKRCLSKSTANITIPTVDPVTIIFHLLSHEKNHPTIAGKSIVSKIISITNAPAMYSFRSQKSLLRFISSILISYPNTAHSFPSPLPVADGGDRFLYEGRHIPRNPKCSPRPLSC